MEFVNPFARAGKWYKANFHTHTTTSDGLVTVDDRVKAYRRAGYGVLAITDHYKTNDLTGLSDKGMLVMSGIEYHPRCPYHAGPHHLVGLNVPHGFGFAENNPQDANACIQAVKDAGGESILAHPFWCGHRYDMYSYLTGYIAMEVYNSTCDGIGRAESNEDWSHLLDAGRMLPAVAVDDAHSLVDPFRGWTWLKLPRLNVESVLNALRTGCFYASTGPEIHSFAVKRGQVQLTCSDAAVVYLMADDAGGSRRWPEKGRKTVNSVSEPVHKYWKYVRAVVVDKQGRKAWTNPIILK